MTQEQEHAIRELEHFLVEVIMSTKPKLYSSYVVTKQEAQTLFVAITELRRGKA